MSEAAAQSGEPEKLLSVPPFSDEEKQWAKQAFSDFDRNNYDGANGFLAKIAAKRPLDPKVLHNKAVVNYYKSGLRRTDEFKAHLRDACSKMKVSFENLSCIDDVDQCTVFYNYSVILYRVQQYHEAITMLQKLFQFVEPMVSDERLSKKVVFLLIELYLTTLQPEKAMAMINLLEKSASGNGKNADKDSAAEVVLQEPLRGRVCHYKTRCYLMINNMKLCKREMKTLSTSLGNQNASMIYIKANYEYLRGNLRKAIKVLNTQPQMQKPTDETGEHVPTMYYNNLGVIHFNMSKHNLGAFYFRKALHENQQIVNEFHKADLSKTLSGRPLTTLGVNRHYFLLYNMGVQLLHCGRPSPAFDCLIETIHFYQVNPRLWLRLAECCIMVYKSSNEEERKLCNRLRVIQLSVGSAIHKKLVLGPGLKDDRRSAESAAIPNTTLEFASLCLNNCLHLLDKACEQPPPSDDTASRPSLENLLVAAPPGNPLRLTEVENLRCSALVAKSYVSLCLNDHVLALQHARQLLQMPRLSGAHRYLAHMYLAEALVAMDKIADAVQELKADEVTDVSVVFPAGGESKQEHDKGEKNGDVSERAAGNPCGLQNWTPRDTTVAKAYMQYNLATAHAIRGEYDKALLYLQMSCHGIGTPLPAQMYFLNIYVELMEGRRKNAQNVIKEHFGHLTSSRPGS